METFMFLIEGIKLGAGIVIIFFLQDIIGKLNTIIKRGDE